MEYTPQRYANGDKEAFRFMVKRKANGEGSITKLPNGNYRLRTVDEIDGIIVRKSFTASSPTACKTAHRECLKSDNIVPIELDFICFSL